MSSDENTYHRRGDRKTYVKHGDNVTVTTHGNLILVHADEVGDKSYYFAALATWEPNKCVYVALGGAYAPNVGGFFPDRMIGEFVMDVRKWMHGRKRNYYDMVTDQDYFLYMLGKQNPNQGKWNLVVAFIFAYLHTQALAADTTAVRLIGTLYNNDQEETKQIFADLIDLPF